MTRGMKYEEGTTTSNRIQEEINFFTDFFTLFLNLSENLIRFKFIHSLDEMK